MKLKAHRVVLSIALTLLGSYLLLLLSVFLLQDRLVWFPTAYEGPRRIEDSELVDLITEDGVALTAWLVPAEEPAGALLFLHGNAGHAAHRLDAARRFRDLGWTVLVLDYRGYGASAGSPSEEGTYLDAEAAYDALVERGFEGRVAVYGESLGCAVAIELARRRAPTRLVLESGFTSIPDVGAAAYPWLPVRWLARVQYDNLSKIGGLDVPLLLVHSPADDIVPFEHAERLLAAAPTGTRLIRTEGGHNDGGLVRRSRWLHEVDLFLRGEADAL